MVLSPRPREGRLTDPAVTRGIPCKGTPSMRSIFLASAAALALLCGDPTASNAQQVGLGIGSITTGALSGTVQGVQSNQGAGSVTAIAGLGAAGVVSGQTASGSGAALGAATCNGSTCASAAGNQQQNATGGGTLAGSFALGGALSGAAGVGAGQSVGSSVGGGNTQFDYLALFAAP